MTQPDPVREYLRQRGASNRLDAEAPAFHGKVRQAFLDLAKAEKRVSAIEVGPRGKATVSELLAGLS